jgi:hypothetical protein
MTRLSTKGSDWQKNGRGRLLLIVLNGSEALDSDDGSTTRAANRRAIFILNKSDIGIKLTPGPALSNPSG